MTVRLGLEGRCGLVMGGTSEVGRACVQRLRAEGMTIGFTGSSGQRGEWIARETGGSFLECDPRDRASCDRAVAQALDLGGGRLDVLVTNAEESFEGSIEATPEAVFRGLLEGNLTSLFRFARACFQPMCDQGAGAMIHIASDAGIRANHKTAAHSVTSAGVIAVAELFAAEGAPHGVRSNAVCPGAVIAAPRGVRSNAVCPGAVIAAPRRGRSGTGADVASLVAWLSCDESAHMTGATLRVDDGMGAAMVIDTRG
jgi:NAD(P)-dependent dehydrogenase (short-subunit alcohol dehydrogenase family)